MTDNGITHNGAGRSVDDETLLMLMPTVASACGYAFAVAAVMDVITLVSSSYATAGVRATYVAMISCYLGFSVAIRLRKARLMTDARYAAVFIRLAWGMVATGLIVRMGIALFTADELPQLGDAVLSVFVGLIVLYLLAFILFDKRLATRASAAVMGISIALVTVRMAGHGEPFVTEAVLPYARAYCVHVIIVAYLYVLARTKEMLTESHSEASVLTVTAGTDELTGLANRRQLNTALDREIADSRRRDTPLAFVIADIDHFKAVNDNHGHAAGDDVLQRTADLLVQATRDSDLVGRWGGEEFVLLLPTADIDDAARVAERCRTTLASYRFPDVGTVTASFGAAVLQPGDDADALVARADHALYRAKDLGRNRVELDVPEPVTDVPVPAADSQPRAAAS